MTGSDEAVKAALCQLRHGEPPSAAWHRARKGMGDLIDRTWKADPNAEMGRDERRLMRKYRATLDEATEAAIESWRRCPTCRPELDHSEGSTS